MLDRALVDAIVEVVADEGQPESVAKRLIAWLTARSEGEPSRDEDTRFLESVRNAMVVEPANED